jgi:hypothetical protein
VRNRYTDFIYLVVALGCSPGLMAQVKTGMGVPASQVGTANYQLEARLGTVPALSLADDSTLPDAPKAADDDDASPTPAPEPQPAPAKKSQQGAPGAASAGSWGIDSRVATGKYWGITTAMFGASIADAELTVRCQEQKTCSYVPPSLRSRAALYGIGLPADAGISYLTYKLKKRENRFWYLPSAFVTGANTYVAIHAYRRSQQKP